MFKIFCQNYYTQNVSKLYLMTLLGYIYITNGMLTEAASDSFLYIRAPTEM